jgi:hypothetical protein
MEDANAKVFAEFKAAAQRALGITCGVYVCMCVFR